MMARRILRSLRTPDIVMRSLRTLLILMTISLTVASCRANELEIGDGAKSDGAVDIPITRVESFNYLTRDQIIAKRTAQVNKFPQLLAKPYEPSFTIFSQIVDNKPWWGMHGAFVWGEGMRSIEGPSEESRFVLNPYLLVGVSSWSCEIWDKEKINDSDLNQPDFPFCWNPVELSLSPRDKCAAETYDVSLFKRSLENWSDQLKDKEENREFGLIAYNARDFGFNYIYVPIDQCTNVKNINNASGPVDIKQFIHCGNTCKYSGQCNNMSPAQESIDHFRYENLPATVKVLLWKDRPATAQTPADMTVSITLK
jgi:hypothetical protein